MFVAKLELLAGVDFLKKMAANSESFFKLSEFDTYGGGYVRFKPFFYFSQREQARSGSGQS